MSVGSLKGCGFPSPPHPEWGCDIARPMQEEFKRQLRLPPVAHEMNGK